MRRHLVVPALSVAVLVVSCSAPATTPAPSANGSSAGTPSVSPGTPASEGLPELTVAFTSTQHGYSIRYPATWTAIPATAPWVFGEDGDVPGDATTDLFRSPATAGLVVSSQALPSGMTEEDWFAAYLQDPGIHPECFPPRADWEPIMIGGEPAGVHGGLAACLFTEAVAVVEGRAYVFTAYPNLEVNVRSVFDRALFDRFLSTVQFRAVGG